MKNKFLILVASLILIFSASYAKGNNNPVPVKVSSMFSSDFSYANNVHWEVMDGYYKASFIEHGKTLYAFYTTDGEFMGLATYISTDRLPATLRSVINEKYSGYWITDLFHSDINNTQGYFITLENADRKFMLKAEENKSWSFYSEVKKS